MRLTDRSAIKALCDQYGFTLSKGYGQNFLVNPGICPKICEAAGLDEDTCVLEIGPGFGVLTQQAAQRARKVVSLEVDLRLKEVLAQTLAEFPNTEVIFQDVMKTDLKSLIADKLDGRATLCANLPYNLTSPIIMRLLEEKLPLDAITVMVQKEAAQRITAQPGTRMSGAITYAVHYYAQPKLEFEVSPGSFFPPPKVTSAVMTLRPRAQLALADQPQREARLFKLIRGAFSQRRKTLANAVSASLLLDKQEIFAALDRLGLLPTARPEELTLETFIQLEAQLWPQ